MRSHWHNFEVSLLVEILSLPLMWINSVSSLVQSLMLISSALLLTVVIVEAEYSMIQLESIMFSVYGKHWVKYAQTCRLVTPLVRFYVDGPLQD